MAWGHLEQLDLTQALVEEVLVVAHDLDADRPSGPQLDRLDRVGEDTAVAGEQIVTRHGINAPRRRGNACMLVYRHRQIWLTVLQFW